MGEMSEAIGLVYLLVKLQRDGTSPQALEGGGTLTNEPGAAEKLGWSSG